MAKKTVLEPIKLTDNETGEKFTLEFSRDSVRFAEGRGFSVGDVGDFPMTKVPDLFFYAFRKNHQNLARARTDKILFETLGGLSRDELERLIHLYSSPMESLIRDEGDETVKNPKMTVEL